MNKIQTLAVALMVLFSITMSAAALESKYMERHDGMSAYAQWTEKMVDNHSCNIYLNVIESDYGTEVYIDMCTLNDDGTWKCMWGSLFTEEDVFELDRNLETATLSPVEVELYDWETGTTKVITIDALWTGTDEAIKGSYKQMSKQGDYFMKFSEKSKHRPAIATGAMDGHELGNSDFAEMFMFDNVYMSMEK